uniref:Fe2OG dioxygenase domain-containing protein n=1 Tax=Pseudo-nitzschia australis TaxID=44445 RepID=A0A7S4EGS1_9STRA
MPTRRSFPLLVIAAAVSLCVTLVLISETTVAVADSNDDNNDDNNARIKHESSSASVPFSAPGPDTKIEYPIRVLGNHRYFKLPDDKRCRWLESGPDVWAANNTKKAEGYTTETKAKAKANANENENATTLDAMFRRIVHMYQQDENHKDKLTVVSSPDDVPPKIVSDYGKPEDRDNFSGDENIDDDDDDDDDDDAYIDHDDDDNYYKFYSGDGGPWVLLIDDFLSDKETNQLIKLGEREGYEKSTIVTFGDDDDTFDDDDDDYDDDIDDDIDDDNDNDIDDDNDNDNATNDKTEVDSKQHQKRTDNGNKNSLGTTETEATQQNAATETIETLSTPKYGRNSKTAWCQSPSCESDELYKGVIDRIRELVQIDSEHSETLQLLHYDVGQYYAEHHDYYSIANPDEWNQDGGRILTVFLYLNDVEGGGETIFPRLNLTVTPQKGRAIVWPSVLDSNPRTIDRRTRHAALSVTKGVKYGANLWFHLKPLKRKWFNYECDELIAGVNAPKPGKEYGDVIWYDDDDDDDDDDDEYFDGEDGELEYQDDLDDNDDRFVHDTKEEF